jgi:TonB family protein
MQASAVSRVDPVYPPQAAAARVAGSVFVEVTVDESGTVTAARAVSGHPLLKDAAVEAARGWSFTPTVLQGKPVRVIGTLRFTFNLPDYILRDRIIERLKQQIALKPDNPKLHYRLGRAYEDKEQFEDALKSYKRAVELDPKFGEAQVAIGAVHMKLNQYDAALDAYKQATLLDLAPGMKASVNRDMALIYFRMEKFKEAVEPFRQAIAITPQGTLYFELGLTYLKLGDKNSAMEQYGQLKEINSILAAQLLEKINAAN